MADIFNSFTNQNFIDFFFKAFAIIFAFMYLIYAIVIAKQTQVMNDTLRITDSARKISFVSNLQIFIGIGLFLLAIFFV